MMLGTFPNDFSQVATSQEYFLKWELPKCVISQAVTSQVCPSRSARPPACSSRGAQLLAHPSRSARAPIEDCVPFYKTGSTLKCRNALAVGFTLSTHLYFYVALDICIL